MFASFVVVFVACCLLTVVYACGLRLLIVLFSCHELYFMCVVYDI